MKRRLRVHWIRATSMLAFAASVLLWIVGFVRPISMTLPIGAWSYRFDAIAGHISLGSMLFTTDRQDLSMQIDSVQWIRDPDGDQVLYTLRLHQTGRLDDPLHLIMFAGKRSNRAVAGYYMVEVRNHSIHASWFTLPLFAFTVWLWLPMWRVRQRLEEGRCIGCGYDLRATPDRCPECAAAPAASRRADSLSKSTADEPVHGV